MEYRYLFFRIEEVYLWAEKIYYSPYYYDPYPWDYPYWWYDRPYWWWRHRVPPYWW
jgi:hypothetical protein